MATGVWDAILFLTKGLVTIRLYFEMCNMGGKPVMKRDELAGGGTEQRGTPRCF